MSLELRVEWYWREETEALWPDFVLQTLCPTQILHALAGDRNRTSLTRGRMRHGKTQHTVMWVWSSFFDVRTSDSWRIFRPYSPDTIRWQALCGELLAGWTVQLSLTEGHNGFLKVNYVTFLWNELPASSVGAAVSVTFVHIADRAWSRLATGGAAI